MVIFEKSIHLSIICDADVMDFAEHLCLVFNFSFYVPPLYLQILRWMAYCIHILLEKLIWENSDSDLAIIE